MRERILNVVLKVLKENLMKDAEITADTKLDELNISSILFVKVIVVLESEFDIEFEDDYLISTYFKTVEDIVAYVERLLENQ